jgi:hypothetical protein
MSKWLQRCALPIAMNTRHGTLSFRALCLYSSNMHAYCLIFMFIEVYGIAQI